MRQPKFSRIPTGDTRAKPYCMQVSQFKSHHNLVTVDFSAVCVIMGNTRSALARKKRSKSGLKLESDQSSSLPSSQSSRSKVQSKIVGGREFHNEDKSVYVLAKDDEEKDRLHEVGGDARYAGRKVELLPHTTDFHLVLVHPRNLLMPELVSPLFENEIDVLDTGCGPGSWVLDMATEYPSVQFYGTDISDTFPQSIYPRNCHFSLANVLDPSPFGDKQFQFIQMRFFAVALRANEWKQAYENLYKILLPGGYLQVLEPSILMDTEDSDIQDIIGAFTKILEKKGQDYDVGPKIPGMLKDIGFNVLMDHKLKSPIGWGGKITERGAEDMRSLYHSIAPFLATALDITVEACHEKIDRAVNRMGPTKTTVNIWAYLAQKPQTE
ncbi:hypothetical protein INT43_008345 [Umbelopsis isabellina]|uniref:Methyltransferase domain-containing protein n=1 Tax=Mortierella isabellina TaxID=91625 RepID=A0A8H7PDD9_MORIS|nr:hypothetical protein INT43_008345 [Umbelopsis isabellina]